MRFRPPRQGLIIALLLLGGGGSWWLAVGRSRCSVIDAGFWFEDVAYSSARLGGPVTTRDVETIAAVARTELSNAFGLLAVRFSDRRDARYRVGVVQQLRDARLRQHAETPAQSWAVTGIGGQGAVSFTFFASSAIAYAPEDATRAAMVEAIGRGIGRAAVHEFAHQLLPTAPIHDSRDIRSYDYPSAARREQFFGEMHWDLAWPLLEKRLGHARMDRSGRVR